jgi:peroxiredoxin
MFKAIQARNKMRKWQNEYDPLAPKVGDAAPDFELRDINSEKTVRLSDFRDKKPVALIFGSYT